MKRSIKFTVGVLASGLLLSGCGDAPAQQDDDASGGYASEIEVSDSFDPDASFSWGFTVYPVSWDPTKSISGGAITFYGAVYDRLLYQEPDGSISPMLATEYTAAEDGKSLTLKLQEGLEFSDGTPFNAEAVKYNLDRNRAQGSTIAGELYQVASVQVVDEYTVTLQLTGGIGPLSVALASRAGVMVSPAAAEAGLLDSQPVGIGPFLATELVPGSSAEFEKTPNYWDPDAQRVAKKTYHLMTDDQTRINALKSGEIDGAVVNPDQMDSLADAGLTPIIRQSSLYLYLALNTDSAPFGDPEVRKALNMAIDREAIAQGLYDGYCTPQIQPFVEGGPGYSEEIGDGLDIFPHDPDAAKQILDEKGISQVDLTLVAPNITIFTKFAEVVQEQLADIGLTAEVKPMPPAEYLQEFGVKKTVEAAGAITTGINDPDVVYHRYIAPDTIHNPGGTAYPELEKWAAEGASSVDPAERNPAYVEFMSSWVEEPPHIVPVCMVHLPSAYSENVSGVSQTASGYTELRYVAVSSDEE